MNARLPSFVHFLFTYSKQSWQQSIRRQLAFPPHAFAHLVMPSPP